MCNLLNLTVEQVVGAVDGFGALDVERVEHRGGRAEETVAPRFADGEAAAAEAAGLRLVAILVTALPASGAQQPASPALWDELAERMAAL